MKKILNFKSFAEAFDESLREYHDFLYANEPEPPLDFYLREDIETFLNLDEFAEIITLNGVALKAIVESSTAEIPRPVRSSDRLRLHSSSPPLIGEHLTIHFKAADYLREKERLPRQSEACRVNGNLFHVISSAAEYGLATLELQAERMNQPISLPGLHEDLEDW